MGPGDLHEALKDLPLVSDPNLIVGREHAEDAGVYKLRDDLAIIQTVDYFTPIVDDPFVFGQIAVVNALSDVYAMGGTPVTAMNIVCFPVKRMDMSVLRDILRGGMDKMREAGVLLVGGHSVEDDELKYGLAVTGTIHPDRVLFNRGALPGDRLVLTKALGTGIVSTALKGNAVSPELAAISVRAMTALNRTASELVAATPHVHACTDITGFGFLGHACEMMESSGIGMIVASDAVPLFPGLEELVASGMVPGGLYRNRKYRERQVDIDPDCPSWRTDVLFDPQTAGGLLVSLPEAEAGDLLRRLHASGLEEAAVVGEVVAAPRGKIRVHDTMHRRKT